MLNICINFWVNLPVHVSTVVKKSNCVLFSIEIPYTCIIMHILIEKLKKLLVHNSYISACALPLNIFMMVTLFVQSLWGTEKVFYESITH